MELLHRRDSVFASLVAEGGESFYESMLESAETAAAAAAATVQASQSRPDSAAASDLNTMDPDELVLREQYVVFMLCCVAYVGKDRLFVSCRGRGCMSRDAFASCLFAAFAGLISSNVFKASNVCRSMANTWSCPAGLTFSTWPGWSRYLGIR